MNKSRICIGLVFGGKSGEHQVSIKSGQSIFQALNSKRNKVRYEIIPIYIDLNGFWWPPKTAKSILEGGPIPKSNELAYNFQGLPIGTEKIDIWFPALHGPNGEDGVIQGLFKLTGKPFVGSGVLGSAIGMDKLSMKSIFKSEGFQQVPYEAIESFDTKNRNSLKSIIQKIERDLGYPCFIKPANLGSSVGITKAFNQEQLKKGLEKASDFDSRIVVEKNISARELECGVIGKKNMRASIVGEIKFDTDWYDYETKYIEGYSSQLIPAPISNEVANEVRALSIRACQSISSFGMARVDFFYEEAKNQLLINEINTLPGFTKQSMYPMLWEASGLSNEKLVAELIEIARE